MNIRLLATAVTGAAALAWAGSAGAATVIVGGFTLENANLAGGMGVHSTGTQTAVSTILSTVNGDGSDVTFHTNTGTLSVTGSGVATIVGDPGVEDLQVAFEKSWNAISFNLSRLGSQNASFALLVNGAALFSSPTCSFCTIGNGQNRFTVTGTGINSLAFNFTPAIGEAKQFSVAIPTPVDVVPEPATWAMMIMGFGGVGALMRRRRTLVAAA